MSPANATDWSSSTTAAGSSAAKLWNDTTSTPELIELRAAIGDEAMVRRVGSLPTAAFTLSKVAWLARHEPDNFARVGRMLLPHDYLTFRLTGRAVTDRSEASGTAYFDAAAGTYLVEYLERIAVRDWLPMLPEVLGPAEIAGQVRRTCSPSSGCPAPFWSAPAAATSTPPLRPRHAARRLGLLLRHFRPFEPPPSAVISSRDTSG